MIWQEEIAFGGLKLLGLKHSVFVLRSMQHEAVVANSLSNPTVTDSVEDPMGQWVEFRDETVGRIGMVRPL